ncbi:hypothetical protein PENTCL1PPCAC_30314, partial [Pristionchus entomophagus]
QITGGLINALIIIAVVVVMTFGLILLYKYKCYKIIGGWLILNSVVLLSFFSMIYVSQLMEMNGWCASSPTVFIGLFNFAVMGIICVHWKGTIHHATGISDHCLCPDGPHFHQTPA